MGKPLVAGNWKMHGSHAFIREYARVLEEAAPFPEVEMVVLPPACYLERARDAMSRFDVAIGAQDVDWHADGPHTGCLAAGMVAESGASWTLVGHSERRASGETDAIVALKCRAAMAAGLNPIVCVGESLPERDAGSAEAVVRRQLEAVIAGLSKPECGLVTVAYEPVWAIGTGRTPGPDEVQSMHHLLRGVLGDAVGSVAERVRLLYGGSVTPENAAVLFAREDVDGLLVGGASLDPEKLLAIAAALKAPVVV